MKKIAIIGAGISGLTLAHQLKAHADIVVFEKARGVGGRMSTRYGDQFEFDHAAQFFTARITPTTIANAANPNPVCWMRLKRNLIPR